MRRERVEMPESVLAEDWLEEKLRGMPHWAQALVPGDLSFTVEMRRRVLAAVPQVMERERRRRVRASLRWVVAAAVLLVVGGGFLLDVRARVPAVASVSSGMVYGGGTIGTAFQASVPQGDVPQDSIPQDSISQEDTSQGGPAQSSVPKGKVERARCLQPVPVFHASSPMPAAGQVAPAGRSQQAGRGEVEPAGTRGAEWYREGRLLEAVAYAGEANGQRLLVTEAGKVWRYVDGHLAPAEALREVTGPRRGQMVLLSGDKGPVAAWLDSTGMLRLTPLTETGGTVETSLQKEGQVRRLSPVGGTGGTGFDGQMLAGVAAPTKDGFGLRLWLLSWTGGQIHLDRESTPLFTGPSDPAVQDLAAFHGDRGITVYLVLQAGSVQHYYLAEWRGERLRWTELKEPLFYPGTAVSSRSEQIAGLSPGRLGLTVLRWQPNRGWTAWLRPGVYAIRELPLPELGVPLRSSFFFSTGDSPVEGMLVIDEEGTVGFLDPSLLLYR
ncbi:MAG TPA: hypothetical protein GX513_05810 [Firmicutes bacterium]|nr:hypothetical protein [Bacillota bacterium]